MELSSIVRYIIAGRLTRDYIILPDHRVQIDIPGGNGLYAAAGLALWDSQIGLISRVNPDYPQEWIAQIAQNGILAHGIQRGAEQFEQRNFIAYDDFETFHHDNPVSHFAQTKEPFPRSLLGFLQPKNELENPDTFREFQYRSPEAIVQKDIPPDLFESSIAHICHLDYFSQEQLIYTFRQAGISNITLDLSPAYMDPIFWNDVHRLVHNVTAVFVDENHLKKLYRSRAADVWQMAEDLGVNGSELVIIKRGLKGQWIYDHHSKKRWELPAYPFSKLVDPTGAMDAFCGGFLASYRGHYDPVEAAIHGSISASVSIECSGPLKILDILPGLIAERVRIQRRLVRPI